MTARAAARCSPPSAIAPAHHEGRRVPAGRRDLVEAGAGDGVHRRAEDDVGRDGRMGRQRLEIVADELQTGRQRLRIRGPPAGILQQATRRVVDVERPGREDPHMAPGLERRRRARAALEDQQRNAALDEPRGCGEPDRTGSDHDDGELRF